MPAAVARGGGHAGGSTGRSAGRDKRMACLAHWTLLLAVPAGRALGAHPGGPKVIGLGDGRTGTQTLVQAMEALGHNVLGDKEIVWNQTFRKAFQDKDRNPERLVQLILEAGFTASIGLGNNAVWVWKTFGTSDAKAILTVRSSESLYRSVWLHNFYEARYMLDTQPDGRSRWAEYCNGKPTSFLFNVLQPLTEGHCYSCAFWHTADQKQNCMNFYEKFNEGRRQLVPSGQLLEFDVKQGWGPLCKFLGVPVPDRPFPRFDGATLRTEAFRRWKRWFWLKTALQAAGYLCLLAGPPCCCICCIWRLFRPKRAKHD